LTGGYVFTDYKAQGQTMGYILIDLERPPRGKLTPFNALSRSHVREQVRCCEASIRCCSRRIRRLTWRGRMVR
ncbi:hypothetical protein C8J57DRAFT_1059791, partial [Mycena rebaudengoi]